MKKLIEILFIALIIYIWSDILYGNDPVRKEPSGTFAIPSDSTWIPDSTIYYQYKDRIGVTPSRKMHWVDLNK